MRTRSVKHPDGPSRPLVRIPRREKIEHDGKVETASEVTWRPGQDSNLRPAA
jgi:hypothetical protein